MVNKETETVFFRADHVVEVESEKVERKYDDVLPEVYYQ